MEVWGPQEGDLSYFLGWKKSRLFQSRDDSGPLHPHVCGWDKGREAIRGREFRPQACDSGTMIPTQLCATAQKAGKLKRKMGPSVVRERRV